MGGDMPMHDEPNAFVQSPRETRDIAEGGESLFGCHQPGHYAAGMKGTVSVTS